MKDLTNLLNQHTKLQFKTVNTLEHPAQSNCTANSFNYDEA